MKSKKIHSLQAGIFRNLALVFAGTLGLTHAFGQAAAAKPEAPGIASMLVPFGAMFVILYFLSIRPQQKKMKEHQAFLTSLKEGDEVVTTSGIFGTIRSIQDKTITLEIDKGVKLKLLRSQIAQGARAETEVKSEVKVVS